MLKKYELKMPHAVYSGEDALGKIPEIFAANGVRRLVVFTDKGIEACQRQPENVIFRRNGMSFFGGQHAVGMQP